ncbi:MAG: hypothetical protein Q9184_005644 [Pyrenodesmia sp. 2 TL-2023]
MPFPVDMKRAATNAEFANIVRLMYLKCPHEIVDIIRDTVYDSLFCDGFVYPQQHVNHGGSCSKAANPIARPTLLREFGKKVEAEYRVRFWKENTFIIGLGEPSYSTQFFEFFPKEAFDHINKIDMTFTIRDLGEWRVKSLRASTTNPLVRKLLAGPIEKPIKRSYKKARKMRIEKSSEHQASDVFSSPSEQPAIKSSMKGSEDPNSEDTGSTEDDDQESAAEDPISPIEELTTNSEQEYHRRRHRQELKTDLETMWFEKFDTIYNLPLTALTLDFTECYGPAGEWLGTGLAQSFPALEKGWPSTFMIHAPDMEKKKEIEELMLKKYLDSISDPDAEA